MSKQNYEILLQTICKTGRIQLEITKSSEFSWQVALAESEQIEGSTVLTASTINTSSFSQEIDDTKSGNDCGRNRHQNNVVKINSNTEFSEIEKYLEDVNKLHRILKDFHGTKDKLIVLCGGLGKELNHSYDQLDGDGFTGKVFELAQQMRIRGLIKAYIRYLLENDIRVLERIKTLVESCSKMEKLTASPSSKQKR